KIDQVIELMESVRREGISLTCDRYPYVAAGTDLDTILPSWVYEGGVDDELRRLRDPGTVARIKSEIEQKGSAYWRGVYISSVTGDKNRWMVGESLHEISSRLGRRPEDVVIDVVIEEKARAGAIFFSMNEDNLRQFLRLPYIMIGSDSSVRSFSGPTRIGNPHPRGFGTFPRFIGRYVRDEGLMGLPDAIKKITSLPADTFGLRKRGLIKEGYYADIAVFDYDRIIDRATFKKPYRRPEGLVHVFVNGVLALRECELTGTVSGRVLK
ncbi:N-acyl-D-amino-acid deacylase, partial [hydrothermal vent metagenome]